MNPNVKKGILCLAIAIVATVQVAIAQTNEFKLPQVIQPSPNAAALGRYGEIPVSVSTGVPNISIPLYEIKTAKHSVPISLSYHSSGVKVNDRSSVAGLGWSLNAGGVITRAMQGIWDEETKGYYNTVFPAADDPCREEKERCLAGGITMMNRVLNPIREDGLPDIFYYNFGSRSGKFMLKNRKAFGLPPEVATIPYSPIKVKFSDVVVSGQTIRWGRIEITDIDGITYVFGCSLDGEVAHETTQSGSGYDDPTNDTSHISAWYLTDIISSDQAEIIKFKYSSPYQTMTISQSVSLLEQYNHYFDPSFVKVTTSKLAFQTSVTEQTTLTSSLNVTSVMFPNGKVLFEYENYTSGSEPVLKRLSAVKVMRSVNQTDEELKRFALSFSSFALAKPENRLRLDAVTESGFKDGVMSTKPPYTFAYSTFAGKEVPDYNSKSQDIWGYYNGKQNDNLIMVRLPARGSSYGDIVSLASKRIPDADYMKVGSLKQITYPTGGKTDLELEPNQIMRSYTRRDTTFNSLNVHIGNLTTTSETFTVTTPLMERTYVLESDPYAIRHPFNAAIYFTVVDQVSGSGIGVQFTYILRDETIGADVSTYTMNASPLQTSQAMYATLVVGHSYRLYFPAPGPPPSQGQQRYIMNVQLKGKYDNYTVVTNNITEPVFTGGLRVKKISSYTPGTDPIIKKYKYNKAYYTTNLFNGDFDDFAIHQYHFDKWIPEESNRGWEELGYEELSIGSRTYAEKIGFSIGGSNGSAAAYEEVEEQQVDLSGNALGKIVNAFYVAQDVVVGAMPTFKSDNSAIRDRLKKKTTYKLYNGQFIPIEEEEYTYTDFSSSEKVKFIIAHEYWSEYYAPGGDAYKCLGCYASFDPQSAFDIQYFYQDIPKAVVTKVVKRSYDGNGLNPVISETLMEYSNPAHLLPTKMTSTTSTGELSIGDSKYPHDALTFPCENTCEATFDAQLDNLKAVLYMCQSTPRRDFHVYQDERDGTILNFIVHPDLVLAANAAYLQCQSDYTNAVYQAVDARTACYAALETCKQNHYNTLSPGDKAIADLQKKNIITPVVEAKQYRGTELLATKKTTFLSFTPQFTGISKVQFATGANPLEDRIEFTGYSSAANILEQKITNDAPVSYLWDYQNQYPIAEVKNASQNEIAYTSFEADGNGNWSIGSATRDNTAAYSGKKCYNLSNGSLFKTTSISKSFRVSFWATAYTSLLVNGTTPTQLVTANGWTLFEIVVSNSPSVTISGTGKIDDVRLSPTNAQMVTFTYDLMIGVVAQSDPNNQTLFYEYDAFGRLIVVRDTNRNILKSFQYNYKQ